MVGVRAGVTICAGLGTVVDALVGKAVGVELGAGKRLGFGNGILAQPARRTMLTSIHTKLEKRILLCINDFFLQRSGNN
jgi:hypothetical protein